MTGALSRAAFRCAAVAVAVTIASLPVPAPALPGQTDAQFKAWVKKIPDLNTNLSKEKDELSGWPAYHVQNGDHGVSWEFRALEDANGNVREETFAMVSGPGDIGSTPIRHDGSGYGFTFLTSQIGSAVTADYKSAKLVAPIPSAGNASATRYYRGTRYGWIVDGGGKMIHLLTFKWFETAVATAIRCAKPGATCSE